jgi:hypothetical protein
VPWIRKKVKNTNAMVRIQRVKRCVSVLVEIKSDQRGLNFACKILTFAKINVFLGEYDD